MEWRCSRSCCLVSCKARIPGAWRRAWFLVMEVDWHASWFRCGTSSWYYISPVGLGFGNGNGECRRCSWIAAQAAGDAGSATLYWGAVEGVMDNEEWSTEHGNIYSALWERCWSIMNDLPPCKVCLIFHTFWKGLIFILLLDVTLSSTKILIPSQMPCKSGTPWFTQDSNLVQCISGKFFRTICHSFDSGFKKEYQNNK